MGIDLSGGAEDLFVGQEIFLENAGPLVYRGVTWAVNSAGECYLHTVEVTGSIPVPPTMKIKGLRFFRSPFFFGDVKVKIGGTSKTTINGSHQKPLSMQFSMKVSDLFCPSAKYANNCLPTSGYRGHSLSLATGTQAMSREWV